MPTKLFYTSCRHTAPRTRQTKPKHLIFIAFLATTTCIFASLASAEPTSSASLPQETRTDEALPAPGNDTRLIYWSIQPPAASANTQATKSAINVLRDGLKEALAAEQSRHLLSEEQFQAHVASTSTPIPLCIIGLEPCVTPKTLAFDTLNLSLIIRLQLQPVASGFEATYEIMDRRGLISRTGTVQANTARTLAFDLVRTIFDATGTLAFDSTPRGAIVEIDGKTIGVTPISQNLPVGTYTYRLVLNDYEPIDGTTEVASERASTIQHDLNRIPDPNGPPESLTSDADAAFHAAQTTSTGLFQPIAREAILPNHYGARLSYDLTFQSTTFRNARGEYGADEYEFRGFTERGAMPDSGPLRRLVMPHGPRLELYYTGESFGLTLLSLSYLQSSPDHEAELELRNDRQPILTTVHKLQRLQFRPFQLTYRMFFGNFVPTAEAGIGINFQWIKLRGNQLSEPITLSQTESFWTAGLGLQYFITPQISAQFRYNLQSYFNDGLGTEHMLNLGVGMLFGNIFGFDAEPPGKL